MIGKKNHTKLNLGQINNLDSLGNKNKTKICNQERKCKYLIKLKQRRRKKKQKNDYLKKKENQLKIYKFVREKQLDK